MKRMILGLLIGACGNTTGGDLVTLPMTAGGITPAPFTTPVGWTVTLDTALIAVGPFYFNVNAPRTGTFRSGIVIIEATEQTIVNALDPAPHAVTGGADGETGEAVAVEIGLLPPDSPNAAADPDDAEILGASFGYVSGTAVDGSMTVAFAGAIAVDQSLVTATEPLADLERIKGATVDLAFTAAPQSLALTIDPTHWFDQSNFAALTGGSWTTDSTFAAQLLQGVKSESGVYQFDLAPAAAAP